MVQMSTSPVAGFSSPASPTLGLSGTVAAGVDDDQIDDEFPIEGHREQELALATRIAELSQDFLADSGVGLAAEHFDRMCEGFVTLQDAYVEETQHFAAKSAGLAKAPVLRALSKLRFQNAGLKTQLEQNRYLTYLTSPYLTSDHLTSPHLALPRLRIGAEMMGEQNRIQLEALRYATQGSNPRLAEGRRQVCYSPVRALPWTGGSSGTRAWASSCSLWRRRLPSGKEVATTRRRRHARSRPRKISSKRVPRRGSTVGRPRPPRMLSTPRRNVRRSWRQSSRGAKPRTLRWRRS